MHGLTTIHKLNREAAEAAGIMKKFEEADKAAALAAEREKAEAKPLQEK